MNAFKNTHDHLSILQIKASQFKKLFTHLWSPVFVHRCKDCVLLFIGELWEQAFKERAFELDGEQLFCSLGLLVRQKGRESYLDGKKKERGRTNKCGKTVDTRT